MASFVESCSGPKIIQYFKFQNSEYIYEVNEQHSLSQHAPNSLFFCTCSHCITFAFSVTCFNRALVSGLYPVHTAASAKH